MAHGKRKSAARLVLEAAQRVENLTPDQVVAELADKQVLLVDLREAEEREQEGVIPGAIHAPRGQLEFFADRASDLHLPEFDPRRRIILYCAAGARSALAADTLQQMGYTDVAHLTGGLRAWRECGQPVEEARSRR